MKHLYFLFIFACSLTLFGQGAMPREELNLDEVYDQYDLTGEGVVVVMIDRGIDYEHPDFIDENGNTRIAYIYDMIDQSGANDPGNIYGVGTIFDQAEINAALQNGDPVLTTDRHGHGTATTGIMCGNGSATADGQFEGVAPGATIISIKITHDPFPAFDDQPGQVGSFNPSNVPIALDFANDKIAELGLPSVTLLNIGSIGGPTDGTSLICRAIDDYVAEGNTFVCGVGDDGGADNFAMGNVLVDEEEIIEIEKGEEGFMRFDLWYSENDKFVVSVERPNGEVVGPFFAPNGPNDAVDNIFGDIQIYHRGANVEFFGATSNRRELLIDFTGEIGTYKVILGGGFIVDGGGYQATLNPSIFLNDNYFLTNVVAGHSINDYSSAVSCISPGDYVVQNDWISLNGAQVFIGQQGDPGELWRGSSLGPTQDGRQGVDFVTPGEVCFGAYSENSWYSNQWQNLIAGGDGKYGLQNAVSAAAPLTAGVIALMLEVNPNLTPAEIKELLQNSCRMDAFTGTVPNNSWGHGKLDALAAIENTLLTDSEEPALTSGGVEIFPNPFVDELQIKALGETNRIEQIEIYDVLGRLVWQSEVLGGPIENIDLGFLEQGMYTILVHGQEGVVEKRALKL